MLADPPAQLPPLPLDATPEQAALLARYATANPAVRVLATKLLASRGYVDLISRAWLERSQPQIQVDAQLQPARAGRRPPGAGGVHAGGPPAG